MQIYITNEKDKLITADEPIVFKDLDKLFNFKSFSFPISENILLVGAEDIKEDITISSVNLLIAQHAQDLIVGSSKELVEKYRDLILPINQNNTTS